MEAKTETDYNLKKYTYGSSGVCVEEYTNYPKPTTNSWPGTSIPSIRLFLSFMLIPIHSDNPGPRQIKQVVEILKAYGVIIYPTDTVYGLGCDIFNQKQ